MGFEKNGLGISEAAGRDERADDAAHRVDDLAEELPWAFHTGVGWWFELAWSLATRES